MNPSAPRLLCRWGRAACQPARWFWLGFWLGCARWVAAAEAEAPPKAPATASEAAATGTSNDLFTTAYHVLSSTNAPREKPVTVDYQAQLEIARHQRLGHQFKEAAATCVSLLESAAPDKVQRTAMLELAQIAHDQNDLPRAQQVYQQCLVHWPKDPGVPELLLRQGLIYRQMGLPSMAITKFYAVMTSSLVLRTERFDTYERLVLLAQNEIAQTQYELGNYIEAARSFDRLLKLELAPANRPTLQFQYIHCLATLARHGEAIAQSQDFLQRYPAAPERPEVHFLCATALKESGRDGEALREVLNLLKEQRTAPTPDPQTLAYWQRRAGNEIANRFYAEGDSMKALDIYMALANLDPSPDWQLPVWYQIGLVFERLHQPAKAIDHYGNIIARAPEVTTNAAPSLKTVLEMARWRKDFLGWQVKTEQANLELHTSLVNPSTNNANRHALQPSRRD
jgi:tetratricopeptide (TPR) repeat protein